MAMAELIMEVDGKQKTFDTADFNEKQKHHYAEASVTERELKRYKYLVAILEDRKVSLLQAIVDAEET